MPGEPYTPDELLTIADEQLHRAISDLESGELPYIASARAYISQAASLLHGELDMYEVRTEEAPPPPVHKLENHREILCGALDRTSADSDWSRVTCLTCLALRVANQQQARRVMHYTLPQHYLLGVACGAAPPDDDTGLAISTHWRLVDCIDCIAKRMAWVHAWRSFGPHSEIVTGCGIDLRGTNAIVTGNPARLDCPDCQAGYEAETGRHPKEWDPEPPRDLYAKLAEPAGFPESHALYEDRS